MILQVAKAAASTRHWNVDVSLPENANVGVESFVGPDGPAPIVVSGAVVSTVNECLSGVESVLPSSSVASTSNVWGPSPSVAAVNGELHDAKAPASTRHWNVDVSLAEKVKVGVVSFVNAGGPESIAVWGATVSTANERLAGVGSVLPNASVARTSKV